jgi:polyribonucleotide 5'-hydroxyl-kinase
LSGTAEIFGTELAQNQLEPYVFQGKKAAIYTWHGCKLEVTGSCQVDYIAEETPMISYANTHFALEALRDHAAESNTLGPRVLVVGSENAGKTSLVKLLAAYANRSGRTPVVTNLDPKEGLLTIPGTISAAAFESIVDVTEGWGSSPINGPSQIPVKLPLVYYYGAEDPDTLGDVFKPLVRRLALSVIHRMEDDTDAKYTGCIVDTAGSMSQGKTNYESIQHVVSEFQINVLIVLGSERLYSDMSRRFAKPASISHAGLSVIKLDKSGGCVDRDALYLQQMRDVQIREYFFGTPRSMLSPHSQLIGFDEVIIYKIGDRKFYFSRQESF